MTPWRSVLGFCGYGFRNVGDDAFLAVLGEQLLGTGAAEQVRVTSDYVPAGWEHRPLVPIYRGMASTRGAPLFRLLRFGRRLGAVLLCGGSVLHEGCHFDRETLKLRALQAANPGLRTAALGVSIGPLHSRAQERRLVRYLNCLDYVSVRDQPSWEFLAAHSLRCRCERHFDLAALLPGTLGSPVATRSRRRLPGARATVGLAACHVQRYRGGDPEIDEVRCRRLAAALRSLARQRAVRFRLFEFNGHPQQGDRPALDAICQQLERPGDVERIAYRADPLHFLEEVGRCDVMLAMRLHSAVFAYLRDVALVPLAYHPKCWGFSQEIGLEADATLDADRFSPDELVAAVERALDGGGRGSLPVEAAVASARRHWSGAFAAWGVAGPRGDDPQLATVPNT